MGLTQQGGCSRTVLELLPPGTHCLPPGVLSVIPRLSCLLSAGGVGGSVLVHLGPVFLLVLDGGVGLLVLAPRGVQRAVAEEEDDGDLEETHQPTATGEAAERGGEGAEHHALYPGRDTLRGAEGEK